MCNLQFEKAHTTFQDWERLHVLQSEFFVHGRHWIT
jgi:hypothetical protein